MPRNLDPKSLIGKTIMAIDCKSINAWKLTFDDETTVVVDTDAGPLGIPKLIVFPYDPKEYNGQW
jgi:hypothetical protein